MLGTSKYEPPQYNKEDEEEQKLVDEVCGWWDSMTEQEQYDLMLEWYPNEITEDDDADKFFGDMKWETKLWIYQRENNCTDEDIEGQIDNAIDCAVHEKMEEDWL